VVEDIKKVLTMDGEESLKEKAMGEVKKKVEKEMGKDKMSKDKTAKDKKDEEMKKKKEEEEMAEDEGSEEMAEGEYGEGAEDEELEDKEQKKEEKKEAGEAKAKDKTAKDADSIRQLVADSVAKEMEKFHKRTMAFDAAIKEYERTCGRVNKLAFDSAGKVLDTILKNHGKNFADKSFAQKQAMVEMLPSGNKNTFSPSLTMDSSAGNAKSHTPEKILNFLKRG